MTPPGVTLAVTPAPDTVLGLVGGAVASRIAAGDTGVWPRTARPGWVGAARGARPLVGEIDALRERLRVAGMDRVVLAATGGVGVAAEVLAGSDPRLVVLDGTDPVAVADALAGDLDATVLVLSVPPGEDATGIDLVAAAFDTAFRAAGLDPREHTVAVAAPGSAPAGRTVVLGPPDVDGPWSVFTAYALVPAGLAGTDVAAVLADAAAAGPGLAADEPGNPALALGALLAGAPIVALTDGGTGPVGGASRVEWVAQLLAAGLGKDGRGPLPVVVESAAAREWSAGALTVGDDSGPADVVVHGGPAGVLLLWQYATAVAAHLLGMDPTDRPDAGAGRPDAGAGPGAATRDRPAFVDGAVAVHASWLPAGTDTVTAALRALAGAAAHPGGHLAVHAYLDRLDDASAALLRPELSRRTGLVTTFGWAPRCLPGGGQRDKGGPPGGVICQVTGAPGPDCDLATGASGDAGTMEDGPLAAFQLAQARADGAELARRGRPVLRLHLIDRVVGLVTLMRAVQEL